MYSAWIRITLVCLSLCAVQVVNAGGILYTRQSSPCSDPTSIYCDGALCCVPGATCLRDADGNTPSQCGETTTLPAPGSTCSPGLSQCLMYSHCCPTIEGCGQDSDGNPQCGGLPYPPPAGSCPTNEGVKCNAYNHCCFPNQICGLDALRNPTCDGVRVDGPPVTREEECAASGYSYCSTYDLCCPQGPQCSLNTSGTPVCGTGGSGTPPPVVNPPVQNPSPGGNASVSRSSTSTTRASTSSTSSPTASNNSAKDNGPMMSAFGSLCVAGLVTVLVG